MAFDVQRMKARQRNNWFVHLTPVHRPVNVFVEITRNGCKCQENSGLLGRPFPHPRQGRATISQLQLQLHKGMPLSLPDRQNYCAFGGHWADALKRVTTSARLIHTYIYYTYLERRDLLVQSTATDSFLPQQNLLVQPFSYAVTSRYHSEGNSKVSK